MDLYFCWSSFLPCSTSWPYACPSLISLNDQCGPTADGIIKGKASIDFYLYLVENYLYHIRWALLLYTAKNPQFASSKKPIDILRLTDLFQVVCQKLLSTGLLQVVASLQTTSCNKPDFTTPVATWWERQVCYNLLEKLQQAGKIRNS